MATSPTRRCDAVNSTGRAVIALVIASLLFAAPVAASSTIDSDEETAGAPHGTLYVDGVATGSADGSSWANAFSSLQDAIDNAPPGSQVWVAAGTYTPSASSNGGSPDERMVHFSLRNGVEVHGGFTGTETLWEERDWQANPAILSGDIGVVGDISDNCYHVLFHPEDTNLDSSAVLDGVTVTFGNADGAGVSGDGGGMFNYMSSPTLNNVIFVNNLADEGGGLFNDTSSPALTNCTIGPNMADDGGGLFNDYFSAPKLVDCSIVGNAAVWNGGGVLNDYFSAPAMENCEISDNLAGWNGGGMLNYNSSAPVLTECTITDNFAWQGGGMYNYFSAPVLVGTVVGGNEAAMEGNQVYNMYARPTVVD